MIVVGLACGHCLMKADCKKGGALASGEEAESGDGMVLTTEVEGVKHQP